MITDKLLRRRPAQDHAENAASPTQRPQIARKTRMFPFKARAGDAGLWFMERASTIVETSCRVAGNRATAFQYFQLVTIARNSRICMKREIGITNLHEMCECRVPMFANDSTLASTTSTGGRRSPSTAQRRLSCTSRSGLSHAHGEFVRWSGEHSVRRREDQAARRRPSVILIFAANTRLKPVLVSPFPAAAVRNRGSLMLSCKVTPGFWLPTAGW